MLKLGFAERWVNNVMRCVESVNYKVKVDGNQLDFIQSSRGLRQSNHISPYLFYLMSRLNVIKSGLYGEHEQYCGSDISYRIAQN